jgi:CDP-6-deoxy-D-xylo-4-hexulose-3-dehydrase
MIGRNYRVAGDLTASDRVMSDTFWIGIYPGLSEEMLSYAADSVETFLGKNF